MDWDEDNEEGDFRRFFGGVNPDKLDIVRLENDPEKNIATLHIKHIRGRSNNT
jgi:hypothetical protein